MQLNNLATIEDNQATYTVSKFDSKHYQDMLTIRQLPQYDVIDEHTITFPARYLDATLDYKELPLPITSWLFDYQKMLVKVAWMKRKYALFLDPGLGKTAIMADLARQYHAVSTTEKIVFCTELNPLRQLYDMCNELDFPPSIFLYDNKSMNFESWLHYPDVPRIGFINHDYFIRHDRNFSDKVGQFFLDESSCLRGGAGGAGKIAKNLIKVTKGIDIKIASSGTPAPNSPFEYAMHALWLELVTSENEFLQQYFVKKENKWTLKRNGYEAMYKDLSSWSFFMRSPAEYGFDDNLKDIPDIEEIYTRVESTSEQIDIIHNKFGGEQNLLPGMAIRPRTMTQRTKFSQVSKGFYYDNGKTIYVDSLKPDAIIDIVKSHPNEQLLIRVVYDAEGNILERKLKEAGFNNGVHIMAKTKISDRLDAIYKFSNGGLGWLMGKAEVLGKGLNLQAHCHIFIVSGQNDSFEDDYQFKKRLHRIGQTEPVLLYRVYTDYEKVILDNVLQKSEQMDKDFAMQQFLYRQSIHAELEEYLEKGDFSYMTEEQIKHSPIITDDYQIYNGNSLTMMLEVLEDKRSVLKPDSIDFSIFSEPFMSDRFTYSKDIGDMGNTKGAGAIGGLQEFMMMRRFFLKGLLAITKPGRLSAMHVEQVPLQKGVDGTIGYFDYRGWAIETARQIGWIPVGDIPIIKNQQAQASVKHVASLAMANMWKNRAKIAPCLNGYLLVFRKPDDNEEAITNIFRCECGWEGVYDECAISIFAPEVKASSSKLPKRTSFLPQDFSRNRPGCPVCGSTDLQSDMNFDRWVRDAMGAWLEGEDTDNGTEKQYSRLKNKEVTETVTKEFAQKLHSALGRFLKGEMDSEFETLMGLWYDIRETEVLNGLMAQDKDALNEDKHLCPLPITIARRAIRLWSNEGDTVLSPFMGSGTEGVVSLELNRKFIGIELKPEYFMMAQHYLQKAVAAKRQLLLPGVK